MFEIKTWWQGAHEKGANLGLAIGISTVQPVQAHQEDSHSQCRWKLAWGAWALLRGTTKHGPRCVKLNKTIVKPTNCSRHHMPTSVHSQADFSTLSLTFFMIGFLVTAQAERFTLWRSNTRCGTPRNLFWIFKSDSAVKSTSAVR